MTEKTEKWLIDILKSISSIEDFIGEDKDFIKYKKNRMLKRAIEREFEIIGEATNRILKENPEMEIANSKRIIGLRNHIIHAYDNVSDEIIWAIIIRDIPDLRKELSNFLEKK